MNLAIRGVQYCDIQPIQQVETWLKVTREESSLSRSSARSPLPSRGTTPAKLTRTTSSQLRQRVNDHQQAANSESSLGSASDCFVTHLGQRRSAELLVEEESIYDTDLEDEEESESSHYAVTNLYHKVCKLFGVVPASVFLRNLVGPTVDMHDQVLGPNGIKALAVALQLSSSVDNLNLEGNAMGYEGLRHVTFMLQENCFITHLNLSYNGLRGPGAAMICTSLRKNPNIRCLELAGNGFRDNDSKHFHNLIENNTAIQNLNLSNNHFCELGAIDLGEAIGKNSSLNVLDLSWNHIRLKGAEGLAQGIKNNTSLQDVFLAMNGLSVNGAESLADAISEHPRIRELDLTNNRIFGNGIRTLAKAIKENTSLQIFRAGLNPMSCGAALDLLQTVEEAQHMEYLDLRGTVVTPEFIDLANKMKSERRRFDYRTGYVTKSSVQKDVDMEEHVLNPLEILLVFMAEQNLRLVDLFKSLDKDQSMSLSRSEFIEGLKEVNTPMTEGELDKLITMLDQDGDGEVDLKEIMNINKDFKHIKTKAAITARENKERAAKSRMKAVVGAFTAAQKVQEAVGEGSTTDGNGS